MRSILLEGRQEKKELLESLLFFVFLFWNWKELPHDIISQIQLAQYTTRESEIF